MSGHNAAAGWYPTGDGRNGYWDGAQWTEFTERNPADDGGDRQAQRGVVGRLADIPVAFPDDAVWTAVGRPITGLGAGRYWMDSRHLYFERGMLSTNSQQVPLHLVMDVDVKQTMVQKARGVFSVYVHVNRTSYVERVLMEDVPDGRAAQRVINEAAHAERVRLQQAQNTMRYQGGSPVAWSGMKAEPAVGQTERDPIAQLKELGTLRDAGIVTEEEFAAKKAEILARM